LTQQEIISPAIAITQRRLLLIVLLIILTAFTLSAYIQSKKVEPGRLFCAQLNQRTMSKLYWDDEGCAMKTERRETG
jgi:hypothetical protein